MIKSALAILAITALPHLQASAAPSTVLYNVTKQQVVVGTNTNVQRPIASLTKLMTAMVALDYDGNLFRTISMRGSNKIPGGKYTREELMTAMLVRSDNGAAEAIAADFPGGRQSFVAAMNKKAAEIGMTNTRFADPSGLSSANVSNVGSVAVMLQVAGLYPFIKSSSILKEISIERKKYRINLDNTNKPLLYDFDEIILSKTGYTSLSGWSLGLVVEKHGQRFSVVILGAEDKNQRYNLTKRMINQLFSDIESEMTAEKNLVWYQRFKRWLGF